MKRIINSKYFKWFRKSFLKSVLYDIEHYNKEFCCNVICLHSLFISWKDLKEVQENLNSKYLKTDVDFKKNHESWFYFRQHRIAFLKECLSKFN